MELRPDQKSTIARRFKAFRRKSLLSQSRLAFALAVCRQSVNEIENRRVLARYGTWESFCALEARHTQARAVSRSMRAAVPVWIVNSK